MSMVLLMFTPWSFADSYTVLKGNEDNGPKKGRTFIPYAFYNSNVDIAASAAYIAHGYIQPQVNIVANAFYSSNNSHNLFYTIQDLQMPFNRRMFLNVYGFTSEFDSLESYREPAGSNNSGPPAGSNDSDGNNFIEGEGDDKLFRLDFSYLLPIGHGKDQPLHRYIVDGNGTLQVGSESGGDSWNPFASGRSFINIEFFDREQEIKYRASNKSKSQATAITLGLEYDNTDYWNNPSYGSRQRIAVTRDWGANDEDGPSWTTIEAEYSKFFNLGPSESAFQRVIAFNVWLIDTPTWDDSSHYDGVEKFHRPPAYQGATLGGLDRQRAYPESRFNDRSAINYAVEYRYKTKWNPFSDIPIINKLHIPWWQWVGFAELGRVHDEWDIGELHQDMKWTVGVGTRIMVEGVAVRVDLGTSEEQAEVQMFIGQTF